MVPVRLSPTLQTTKTNERAGNGTVQVMHQTVREFFLDPNGPVASSEFRMCEKDAHICMSMTCLRYLMLCAVNTTSAERPPDIKFWTSEHFKGYAQYLDDMPLASYALDHLKHHIDGCKQDANIQRMFSQFISKLTYKPAVYLLGSWVSSQLKKNLINHEPGAAKRFRDKILRTAARNGFAMAVEVLLIAGADVNAKDEAGWMTPLSGAAEGGHEAVVGLLLETGKVDVDSKDRYGRTPLWGAAEGWHEAVVKLLLETGKVDVDSKGQDGRTPLLGAAKGGHEAVVELLLETGKVDVESKDKEGLTPLSWAVHGGHEEVVKLLRRSI